MTSANRQQVGEWGSLNKKETYVAKLQRAVGGRLMILITASLQGQGRFSNHIIQRLSMRKFYFRF
jgi:hypothetical protein